MRDSQNPQNACSPIPLIKKKTKYLNFTKSSAA